MVSAVELDAPIQSWTMSATIMRKPTIREWTVVQDCYCNMQLFIVLVNNEKFELKILEFRQYFRYQYCFVFVISLLNVYDL